MNFYQLTNGEVAAFDDPANAPEDAIEITEVQFAQVASACVLTLPQTQAAQADTLTSGCHAAIVSGFSSSALGTLSTYPSDPTSQGNQSAVANSPSGGGLWCSASTTALTTHTQAQAQQVCSDLVKWINACQTQLATLLAQINEPTATIASVQATAWRNPSA